MDVKGSDHIILLCHCSLMVNTALDLGVKPKFHLMDFALWRICVSEYLLDDSCTFFWNKAQDSQFSLTKKKIIQILQTKQSLTNSSKEIQSLPTRHHITHV
jgi:hypothetical protein